MTSCTCVLSLVDLILLNWLNKRRHVVQTVLSNLFYPPFLWGACVNHRESISSQPVVELTNGIRAWSPYFALVSKACEIQVVPFDDGQQRVSLFDSFNIIRWIKLLILESVHESYHQVF